MEKNSKERFSDLTLLTAGNTKYPTAPGEAKLETFDNLYADRDYVIEFDCPEYTSLCPVTGQSNLTVRNTRHFVLSQDSPISDTSSSGMLLIKNVLKANH